MSWKALSANYRDLVAARARGESTDDVWEAFSDAAKNVFKNPPYHLVSLLSVLKQVQGDRPPSEMTILDHGCGGAMTCLVLLANGYTGVHGVDVESSDCDKWNGFLRDCYGITELRFFRYGGDRLPLPDASFDFVFSQQVLEHVRPGVLESYYDEEVRVLRPGGGAFHEVPHRMTPFDSHTRCWFLHFLPRGLWLWLLENVIKIDTATAREAIFLRWPWVHRNIARRKFGNVADLTRNRLKHRPDASIYDGPIGLRMLIYRLFNIPVLGDLCLMLLSNLVMLQTFSMKPVRKASD